MILYFLTGKIHDIIQIEINHSSKLSFHLLQVLHDLDLKFLGQDLPSDAVLHLREDLLLVNLQSFLEFLIALHSHFGLIDSEPQHRHGHFNQPGDIALLIFDLSEAADEFPTQSVHFLIDKPLDFFGLHLIRVLYIRQLILRESHEGGNSIELYEINGKILQVFEPQSFVT
jgi:hypothetical protein